MMAIYEALQQSGFLPLLVIITALILEWLIPWPEKAHPLTLLRLMALNLAARVNPNAPRSAAQQRISGSLAIIVLLAPILVIISIPLFLAEYPLFFDTLMLIVAIQFQPVRRHFKGVQKALKSEKKNLARHHLNGLVLRETNTLTPMGIAKAAIESLNQRFIYQQFAIIFWYLLAGGLAALVIRMLYELNQIWNMKLVKNRQFGLPIALLTQLLLFVPQVIFALIFSIGTGFVGAYKGFKGVSQKQFFNSYIKAIIGGGLGVQLGGPAIYQNIKIRSQRVGASREVRYADLQRSWQSMYQTLFIFLTLIALVLAVTYKLF
ncbi:cobalamin biosynthesis protein [Aliiglaciecola sp. 2_MG-2023]|uniref:cobalamin biosynthesis protein CobD/CbiB n=1 Tax=unclassified Aliiglaciecola TaxID=2593648 RepID=UPI0026E2FCBC|nr:MULTISPECIES: cobalamin biosynthesis protein [unclassified Aliiglaciecola]MDO6712477.1 cobalamin biosynthesis protein [Aliiglaciecola sp. 2_MG-2023]MDO6753465.1 cobalamin biosynthesis protein [Aliiglaciecola sp. 1_MG-2023]